MKKLLTVLLISILCLVIVGAALAQRGMGTWLSSGVVMKGITKVPEQFEGVGIFLSTDKSIYRMGEPIIMKLKVFNYGSEEIVLHFRSSQRFDLSIFKGEEEISRWSEDKSFAQVLGEEFLASEEIIVYEQKFEGELEAGSYKIIGEITAEDKPLTASLTITIKKD